MSPFGDSTAEAPVNLLVKEARKHDL
jgi:hypothetical protein